MRRDDTRIGNGEGRDRVAGAAGLAHDPDDRRTCRGRAVARGDRRSRSDTRRDDPREARVRAAPPRRTATEPTLGFLYGTIFHGPARDLGGTIRNVCIFAEGSAWITGRHEFLVAPDDPLAEGF